MEIWILYREKGERVVSKTVRNWTVKNIVK